MESITFGQWLKQRRKMLDLTQTELAERVGCAMMTIQKIEADERRPSKQIAQGLANALELTTEEAAAFLRVARADRTADYLPPRVTAHTGASRLAAAAPPPPALQPAGPAAPPLPSGTVTLLFTDLEGSTQLLQRLGARYGEVLAEYRALLRAISQAHAGREVDTQGDAFFVAFPRALDAVQAAVEMQQALATHAWPEGVTLATRMGVHSGEPWQGSEGYIGLDVVRAARIAAVGHGGQVLLSEATRALVERGLPDGVSLRELGGIISSISTSRRRSSSW